MIIFTLVWTGTVVSRDAGPVLCKAFHIAPVDQEEWGCMAWIISHCTWHRQGRSQVFITQEHFQVLKNGSLQTHSSGPGGIPSVALRLTPAQQMASAERFVMQPYWNPFLFLVLNDPGCVGAQCSDLRCQYTQSKSDFWNSQMYEHEIQIFSETNTHFPWIYFLTIVLCWPRLKHYSVVNFYRCNLVFYWHQFIWFQPIIYFNHYISMQENQLYKSPLVKQLMGI